MEGNENFLPVPFSQNTKRDTSVCPFCYNAVKGKKKFCSKDCERKFTDRLDMVFGDRVESCLRMNRKILKEFFQKRKRVVTKAELLKKGYDFDYCTQVVKDLVFHNRIYCFEYGIQLNVAGTEYEILKLNAIESKLMKGQ